jgi:hypothetical protein
MATLSIQPSTEFNPSAVNFSKLRKNKNGGKAVYLNGDNNSKLFIQFPYMRAPFGLSTFVDENTKKTSYSLDLSFDPNDPEVDDLQKKLQQLDDAVIEMVAKNSQEWLGKKYNVAVIKEALYKPLVRPNKGDYPSTLKLKILTDNRTGDFVPEAYNHLREQVSMKNLEKGQKILTIVDINQIWFIDNKFGISIRLQQALLEPSKKLPAFAFLGVEDECEEVDEN